jgi:hypothetical protein
MSMAVSVTALELFILKKKKPIFYGLKNKTMSMAVTVTALELFILRIWKWSI